MKGIWQSATTQMQVFYLLLLIIFSFVVFSLIGMTAILVGGTPNMIDLHQGSTMGVLKWIQACSAIGLFIVPPLLFTYFTNTKLAWGGFNRQQLLLVVAIMLFSMPLVNVLAIWNEALHLPSFLQPLENWMRQAESDAMRMTQAFLVMNTPLDLLINLLIIAVIPALGEELLFRGLIQKLVYKWKSNIHLSIWLTAFLFSAVHMQFLGFFPRMLLGALLGYMLVWTGSLWLPIMAHFTTNAIAVLMTYFSGLEPLQSTLENSELGLELVVSVVGTLLLLYIFKELSDKKGAKKPLH